MITRRTWDEDIRLLGFYDVKPETIVVAAPVAEIASEWRLVVVDNKVVAASQYKQEDRQEPPTEVLDYGQKVLDESDYQPDSAWVLDVCQKSCENRVGRKRGDPYAA